MHLKEPSPNESLNAEHNFTHVHITILYFNFSIGSRLLILRSLFLLLELIFFITFLVDPASF